MNQRSILGERATRRRALTAAVAALAVACSDTQEPEQGSAQAPLRQAITPTKLKRDDDALLKRADLARLSEESRARLRALLATSEQPVAVVVAPENGAVQRLRGAFGADSKEPAEAALLFLSRNAEAFGMGKAAQLTVTGTEKVAGGVRVHLAQRWGESAVFGAGASVTFGEGGGVSEICSQITTIDKELGKPAVSREEAEKIAAREANSTLKGVPAELVVFDPSHQTLDGGAPRLAWLFQVESEEGVTRVFIDATTGAPLQSVFATQQDEESQSACPSNPVPLFHVNDATHVPDFLTFPGAGLWLPAAASGKPEEVALAFFAEHPLVFGTGSVPDQLVVQRVEREALTHSTHVVLQQTWGGLRVFGAELRVHLSPALTITSISGNYLHNPAVAPVLQVSEKAAGDTAVQFLRKQRKALGVSDDPAKELQPLGPFIYPAVLGQGPGARNAAVYGFRFADAEIFVRAAGGETGEVFAAHPLLSPAQRNVYDAFTGGLLSFPTRVMTDGVPAPGLTPSAEALATEPLLNTTLSLFTRFGRASYDGNDSPANVVTNANLALVGGCGARALWDPFRKEMWFCPGMVVGDVLAHEFTHGVTASTAMLLPLDEAGALNEHYSDVFGTLAFPDKPGTWQIGEALGSFRDLASDLPLTYSGKIPRGAGCTRPEDVFTPACDAGRVHSNCAIGNHAAVFLADGDLPSGHAGVGRDRLGQLFLSTLTRHMHPWSTYIDEALNTAQVARQFQASGVQVTSTATGNTGTLLSYDRSVVNEVGWAFGRVGVDPRLIAGWFAVPGAGLLRGSQVFFPGETLPACFLTGDVELQLRALDPLGANVPWWTGTALASTGGAIPGPGGLFGAAIAASGIGTSSKQTTVNFFNSSFLPIEMRPTIRPIPDPTCGPSGTPVGTLPAASESWTRGPTHWAFAVGGKGDDDVNLGLLMTEAGNRLQGCPITDIFLELLDNHGGVIGTTTLGGPDVVSHYGPFGALSFGARLVQTSPNAGAGDPHVKVHWWFDVGSAVRYQIHYFSTGTDCLPQ